MFQTFLALAQDALSTVAPFGGNTWSNKPLEEFHHFTIEPPEAISQKTSARDTRRSPNIFPSL